MNVSFDRRNAVYVRHGYEDVVERTKQEIADFLTNGNLAPEQILMLSYLPFISHIFIKNYSNERQLKENEIKILFHNTENTPIIITVSKELHDFLAIR